jgi:hypothetical protein
MHQALRCGAKSKRTGLHCQRQLSEAIRSVACMDPATGRLRDNRNGWKHGPYSAETIAVGRLVRDMARAARETLPQ